MPNCYKNSILFITIMLFTAYPLFADELPTTASTGTGTSTTANSWTTIASTTIDVTNIDNVLVYATFTNQITANPTVARILTMRFTDNAGTPNLSNEIIRYMRDGRLRIGSLFYIFDVSSLTGNLTYTLQHSCDDKKGTTSTGTIVAMSLNTDVSPYPSLNYNMKAITTGVTTTSATYVAVTGLTTDAITLPIYDGFLVAASVNCQKTVADADTDQGEWALQMQKDGGGYSEIGSSIIRTIESITDIGMVTLFAVLADQASGDYNFRVVHRVANGSPTIQTENTTLVAVALGYIKSGAGGRHFTTNETTVSTISTSSTTAVSAATLSSVTAKGTSILLLSQFGTQALAASTPYFSLTSSGGSVTSSILQRGLSGSTDRGAGGITGLVTGLTPGNSYNLVFNHYEPAGSTTITTTDIIFGAIQLTDTESPGYWTGTTNTAWGTTTNWYDGIEPTSSTNVTLYNQTNNPIISASGEACNNLEIKTGSLTISSSGDLTVSGTITNTDNTKLTIQSTSASLTGSLIHTAGTPNATVERYLTDDVWHMVTPSTTGVTAGDFYWNDLPKSWLTYHTESDDSWTYIITRPTLLLVGQGYANWLDLDTKSPATATMEGNLRSTDLSPTLAYTDASHGYNLVGNPFSSAIDLGDGTGWTFTNVEQTIWVWDEGSGNYLNRTTGGAGTKLNGIVPVGQGFFVRATAGSPVLTIPTSARTHNSQAFYKGDNKAKGYDSYITLRSSYGNVFDEVWISFGTNGTEDFDNGWDASKMFGSEEAPQLYLVEGGRMLSIDHLPVLVSGQDRIVALSYMPGIDGPQTLMANTQNISDTSIVLEDLKTGQLQNIVQNPAYNFTAFEVDDPDRFLLHFKYSPIGIDDLGQEQRNDINIYSYDRCIYIRSSGEAINQSGTVTVFDILGRILLQEQINAQKLVRIPAHNLHNYIIVKVVKKDFIKTEELYIK